MEVGHNRDLNPVIKLVVKRNVVARTTTGSGLVYCVFLKKHFYRVDVCCHDCIESKDILQMHQLTLAQLTQFTNDITVFVQRKVVRVEFPRASSKDDFFRPRAHKQGGGKTNINAFQGGVYYTHRHTIQFRFCPGKQNLLHATAFIHAIHQLELGHATTTHTYTDANIAY